jgi:chorismate dehydratase
MAAPRKGSYDQPSMSAPLRVGSPPYLVARPLNEGLDRAEGIELVLDVPARLIQALRNGALDAALVSAIELFRRPGYRYLAGPAVTGRGFVASVQVFLRKPLAAVRSVALDPASRAGAALTRIVLPEATGSAPEFVDLPPLADPATAAADAWLAIGDPALRTYLSPAAPPVFNPCAAWVELTGLAYVFAVWILRPGARIGERHLEHFAEAQARGAAALESLCSEASRAWKLPLAACRRYLAEECGFAAGSELEASLSELRRRAAALDLCRADLLPEPIPVPAVKCPA